DDEFECHAVDIETFVIEGHDEDLGNGNGNGNGNYHANWDLHPYDKDAIFYAHFPKLRTLLRDTFHRRRGKPVWTIIMNDRFMHNWDVAMRYADARQIPDEWVDDWKQQAKDIVGAMGT
ncbi:MAG: hypothetical protein ABI134_10360, partial [Byssovorax sp.]